MNVDKNDIDNLRILKNNYKFFDYLNDSAVNEMKKTLENAIAIICQYIAEHPSELKY
ncbi:MAG: hypothetical protein JEZ05_00280 [Tenericutes bacterium]|nr:hypothetical protein [Mycoplasmatota bacterium]